jgi:hypothetical protein
MVHTPNAYTAENTLMGLVNVPIQTMVFLAENLQPTKSGRLWLPVSKYVLGSMGSMPAEFPYPASSNTSAPDVARNHIMLNPVLRKEYFPIVTPLRWNKWHKLLEESDGLNEFVEVPKGLHDGFCIGSTFRVNSFYIPPNHKSALKNPEAVNKYIAKEMAAGHYSKPYDPATLGHQISYFHTSPISVVNKDGKDHIVNDHSWPRHNPEIFSINSQIDAKSFPSDCSTFLECLMWVATTPPGPQASMFDVDAAYHQMPIAPEDQHYVAITWDGNIHINTNFSFSGSSSPGVFSLLANAITFIFRFKKIEDLIKWVDDFVFFRYPVLPSSSGLGHIPILRNTSGTLLQSSNGLGHHQNILLSTRSSPTSVLSGILKQKLSTFPTKRNINSL